VEVSNITVHLNGENITDLFDVSETLMQGISPPLINGLNVLKVQDGASVPIIQRFQYFDNGMQNNYTPLLNESTYLDVLMERYDTAAHERVMAYAKERGYTNDISIPAEIVVDDSNVALVGLLHDTDIPGPDRAYILSVELDVPQEGSTILTYLTIQTGECILEVVNEVQGQIFDLCQETALSPPTPSLNNDTLFSPTAFQIRSVSGVSAAPCGNCDISFMGHIFGTMKSIITCTLKSSLSCAGSLRGMVGSSNKAGECFTQNITGTCDGDGNGGSEADPHFTTIDGMFYDNQLLGEFVLLRSKTEGGFEIQTRQQATLPNQCVTTNSAAAMKLGEHVVEYRMDDTIIINGEPVVIEEDSIVSLSGGIQVERKSGMQFYDDDGNKVFIENKGNYLDVEVHIKSTLADSVEGLLGNFDGRIDNDTMLRSGELSWALEVFSDDWRITSAESLFTYKPEESTDTFTLDQPCVLIPSEEHIIAAKQIYANSCGFESVDTDGLVNAIALDLSAGLDEVSWFNKICADSSIENAVVPWLEIGLHLTVDSHANIFGAGHSVPLRAGGELPPFIDLPQGTDRVLSILGVTGIVGSALGADNEAEGGSFRTNLIADSGISGIIHNTKSLFLTGVFIGTDEPVEPAPPTLDFSSDFTELTPLLNQSFFIGDGQVGVGEGAIQAFHIPDGAIRLYLGFADGRNFTGSPGAYSDNTGALEAYFFIQD